MMGEMDPATSPQMARGVRVVRWAALFLGIWTALALLAGGAAWLWLRTGSAPLRSAWGKAAPDFALPDQTGRQHRLADYAGRPVVLLFWPSLLDGRLQEALRSVRDRQADLDEYGVKTFVISAAPAEERAWLHRQARLTFPLLGDEDRRVTRLYAALDDDVGPEALGMVVNPEGRVAGLVSPEPPGEFGRIVVAGVQCCVQPDALGDLHRVGRVVPNLPLPEAVGGTLLGNARGATVALSLSGRCPCSEAYDGRLRSLAAEWQAKGVRFVGFVASADETAETVARFRREAALPFPVFRDEGGVLADALGARVTPEAFVLDRDGRIVYHGQVDDNRNPRLTRVRYLDAALRALAQGKPPPIRETRAAGCAIARARS